MNKLTYFVNNNGTMEITQDKPDGKVIVHTFHDSNDYSDTTNDIEIPNGDMVMLVNLYQYIKRNDIQNDFINPYGKNREDKIQGDAMENRKPVKHPCQGCIYYKACGDSARVEPCKGRATKRDIKQSKKG